MCWFTFERSTYKRDKQDLYQSPVFRIDSKLVNDSNVQKSILNLHRQTTKHKTYCFSDANSSRTCVDQRFKYLNAGSLIKCSAHALVTFVNAKLKHSRLPNDPLDNNLARSLSVERDGRVNFLGPPFCCNSLSAICRSQTLAYIFKPVDVDCKVEINCNLLSRFSTASRSSIAHKVYGTNNSISFLENKKKEYF